MHAACALPTAERKDLGALAGRADAQRRLECLLEALRGANCGATSRTSP